MDLTLAFSLGDVITAIATVFTAVAAWAAVKTVSTQTTPDVIAYPEICTEKSRLIRLVFRNIGHAPAYDIHINLSKGIALEGDEKTRAQAFCNTGIAMLAPGQSFDFLLGDCVELKERWEFRSEAPIISLSYFGKVDKNRLETQSHFGRGKQYYESFPLDLCPFFGHASISVTTARDTRFQNALRAVIKLPSEIESLRKAIELDKETR